MNSRKGQSSKHNRKSSSSSSKSKVRNEDLQNIVNEEESICFGIKGMKERYTLSKTNQTFTSEKRFTLDGLGEEFSNIVQQLTARNWLSLVDEPGEFFPELVIEFCASCQDRQEILGLRGLVEKYPNLPSVLEQGVEIDITP